MKNIVLVCLFILALCGCNATEKDVVDSINYHAVEEWSPFEVEVVQVGEPLKMTNLVPTIVRLRHGELIRVLAIEKLSVGQQVKLIKVSHQANRSHYEGFNVLVTSKK